MSQIVWKKILLPDLNLAGTTLQDESYKDQVENVRHYAVASQDIAIPDPKSFRSMSRASVFLSHLAMQAQDELKKFTDESPFAVGIYCAVENGPIDAPSTVKILAQNDPKNFGDYYRKFRNPKMYLKQLPNLVPAQMGISLGLQGTMNVYTHSSQGSIQALEQAEWDLKTGAVKAAFVCTAHAFDDFMVVKRTRHFDNRCITEAAAGALLVSNGEFTDWSKSSVDDPKNTFGISNQLINLLKGETL